MLASGTDQMTMTAHSTDESDVDSWCCAVRHALTRVIGSRVFCRSERLCGFLRFIVEQSLDRCGGPVKEYVIATEVYGRPASFDPRFDPIVRMEARRLRRKLREYYSAEGLTDGIEIALPVGGYVPVLRRRAPEPIGRGAIDGPAVRSVIVAPFAASADQNLTCDFSRALREEVARELDDDGLTVRVSDGCRTFADTAHPIGLLQGDVRRNGEELRVAAWLTDPRDEAVIWSQVYSRKASDFTARHIIASAIASAVFQAASLYGAD